MTDRVKIFVMSREEAEAYRPHAAEPAACVSIRDPGTGEPTLHGAFRAVLSLAFHDIEAKWAGEMTDTERPAIPCNRFTARRILEFVYHQLRAGTRVFVVHCEAGVSRSRTVAEALAVLIDYRVVNTTVARAMFEAAEDLGRPPLRLQTMVCKLAALERTPTSEGSST